MDDQRSAPTVPHLLRARATSSPQGAALYYQDDTAAWQAISWEGYWRKTQNLAHAFRRLGLQKGDRLALLAPTSLAWELVHVATMAAGGILVGLEPHDTAERLQYIVEHTDANAFVIQNCTLLRKLSLSCLQRSQFVIMLEPAPAPSSEMNLVAWDALLQTTSADLSPVFPAPGDPATIVYTSGTTGVPKGILYTQKQLILACTAIVNLFPDIQEGSKFICWFPLANLFQRMLNLCAMAAGGATYLLADPLQVLAVLPQSQPDVFIGVPRFYEKLYAGIQAEIARKPWWLRSLIRWAIRTGDRYAQAIRQSHTPSLSLRARRWLSDQLVLRRLRAIMGGHIRLMISGAAPIPPYLLEFFHALGLLILEAYGLSENIVPMAFNRPRNFRFGSVGQSLVANDIRLGPDNEVLVRGPGVFAGYYRDAASQAQFTPEGYYCTGDYATVDEEGFLYLLGRKSEIIKTSGGRRIAPAGIEASLRQIDYIDQAVICGDGHKCLIGMLAIDWNLLCRRMEGIDQEDFNGEYPALLAPMRSLILEDITRYTARFPQHEQPAGFLLLRRELSIAEGDITPNLKLRRGAIATKYQADIEALYRAIEDRAAVAPSPSLQQPLLRYG